MREIKFRAWNPYTKEMLNNVGYHPHLGMDLAAEDEHYKTNSEGRFLVAPFQSWNVMQYTGLKDKNGKEIYEGDILSWGSIKMKCYYSESQAAFRLKYLGMSFNNMVTKQTVSECEIIGNKYENRELVK